MSRRRSTSRAHNLIVVTLGFILAAVVAPTASAKQPLGEDLVRRLSRAADPALAFAAFSPVEQQVALHYLVVTRFADEAPAASPLSRDVAVLAGGCWTVTWGRSAYSAVGLELFSVKQRIDWCGNGSTITYKVRLRWVETYVPCYSGTIIQDPTWGGVGQWSFRAFVQADFAWVCPPIAGHWYPWLDMTVTAAGGLSGSGGGT